MQISSGRFDSVTISLPESGTPCPSALCAVLVEQLVDPKGAVYVQVPESQLSSYLSLLRSLGAKFHRAQDGLYTYYLWRVKDAAGNPIEDKVPPYATSIEGVGGLIFSPDSRRLLLVWEYGKWKMVTGAMKAGESPVQTFQREVFEETGLEIDPAKAVRIGGWHIARARFGTVNDNFTAFAVHAKSCDEKVDGIEIQRAKWFDVEELLGLKVGPVPETDPTSASLEALETKFSWIALAWLQGIHHSTQPWISGKYTLYL